MKNWFGQKRIIKYFLLLAWVLIVIPFLVYAWKSSAASKDYYRSDTGTAITVDEWGQCRKIKNTSDKNYFIPTKTKSEWESFIKAVEENPGRFPQLEFSSCEEEQLCYSECKVTLQKFNASTLINMSADSGNRRCANEFGTDWEWAYWKCLTSDCCPGDIGYDATVGHASSCWETTLPVCVAEGMPKEETERQRWYSAARDEIDYYVTWSYNGTPTLLCDPYYQDCRGPCEWSYGGRGWGFWDIWGTGCEYYYNCNPSCGVAPLLCCKKDPNNPL